MQPTLILAAFATLFFGVWDSDIAAAAQASPHIRGTLTKVSSSDLVVATAGGPVTVEINSKTRIVGVVPATLADITSGAFIGTANVPARSGQSARALEVVVFPKAMAGTGEGDYAWDLPSGAASSMTNGSVAPHGGSMMTNGTVGARAGSMMTNATVTSVNQGASKTVMLQYKGGSKSVTIGPGTPIVRAVPGSAILLVSGAHIVTSRASGAVPAVIVGEHGIVPPM